jgi:integrase
MRRYGSGSKTQLPSGKWRARISTEGGRASITVETEAEADALLLRRQQHSSVSVKSTITLSDYGAAWLDRRDAEGLTDERSRWRVHIEPSALASLPIRAIEPRHVRAWVDALARSTASKGNQHAARVCRPIARQTATNALNLLRACLSAAVDAGALPSNPATGVRVPRRREDLRKATTEDWTWLDGYELDALYVACGEPYRWLVQFAVWTGLREGELWELRRVDIHADGGRPHAVVRYGSSDGPTKTRKIRYVPLLPGALEAWDRWQADEVAAKRIKTTGVAFPPLRGSTRKTRACGPPSWWEQAVERAGVVGQTGAPVVWHSLRHTCASSLVSGAWGPAWSLEEIRGLLGHASIATTQRYAHLASSALDNAAARTRLALSGHDLDTRK